MKTRLSLLAAALGAVLVAINLVGAFGTPRAPEIDGYVDFAGTPTEGAGQTLAKLQALPADTAAFSVAAEATRIIHDGIAHVSPADIDTRGLAHYGMRVPVTENWVLFALSFLKPDTYRDYEFCSYERAIERGTGRCGQQSLALVAFLEERGFETGFVALGGHAIATARTDESGWVLLDPDYGGVIPFDLAQAEVRTEDLLSYYWTDVARENRIDRLYDPQGNELRLGGVRARYARACPIEEAAYGAKWLVPIALLLPALLLLPVSRKNKAY
ncbi:MAG: hypothetical protein V2I24_05975 [Halieaceae bacterium]|jgi:hypothetical protein|nr:hypothetical protein [Halieaceae bacterium]